MQSRSSNQFTGVLSLLGLAALLTGLIVMVLLTQIRLAAWALLLLGVLLLATAVFVDFRKFRGVITGRRSKFSTGTTVMVSIFLGITLLVNAISITNYKRIDVTGVSQFTLTSQTQDVLKELDSPVQAIGFFVPGDPYGIGVDIASYARNLLSEYKIFTEYLHVEEIDPEEHPDQAVQYGITYQYQSVVFESGNHRRLVTPQEIIDQAEHAFTSAILEVTGVKQKKVYFITGHGEADISVEYSQAKQGLLDNLYNVDTLDLVINPNIPEDANALIIAGPRKPLASSEVEIIKEYLENDGLLMILLNPGSPPEVNQLISAWGIEIEDGIAIDPSSHVSPSIDSPMVPRTMNYFSQFGLSKETYFPGATAILPQEEYPENIILLPLFFTSQESWLEKDFNTLEEPEFNEGTDIKGPLPLAFFATTATAEGDEVVTPEEDVPTSLVIVGDSDFASDQHFYNGDNGNLFLSMIEFLTAGKELISIERKVLPFRRLVVSQEIANFINISSIGLLPIAVLLLGGIIWWRRR